MIEIQDLLLFLTGVLNLILGIFVFVKNKKSKINQFYFLLTIATACWAFGLALFRMTSDLSLAELCAKAYYLSANLIGISFLLFCIHFPYENKKFSKTVKYLFVLAYLFLTFISIWPNMMIEEVGIYPWGKEVVLGPLYNWYILYFLSAMVVAVSELFRKYRGSRGIMRIQLKYVLAGYLVAILGGVTFNLILPVWNYQMIWVGPLFTIILTAFIFYAILKHHLLNIKVIATEAFSLLIAITLLIDALLSDSKVEFFLKALLFIIVTIFGYLLIRSVTAEIRAKEKIAKISSDLKSANVELRRLDKAKSEFLSIASHQLRTPLTAIKGYSSMILEGEFGKINKELKEVMDKIFQSSHRLVLIVEDFLNISRIEAGKMKYDFTAFDLKKVIKNLVNDFITNNEKARDLNLQFTWESGDFLINADQNKITQVISNIMDNALKYTSKGFVKIDLSKNKQKGTILIKVQDTGTGISKETIPRLFQKFTRAKEISRLHTDGSGLGLYVAKRIIEDHHGKIWLKSEGKDKGSTFFVELPAP